MKLLFQLLSLLPLFVLQALGAVLGLMVFAVSRTYRLKLRANLRQSELAQMTGWHGTLVAACQAGMMVTELPRLWLGRAVHVIWQDRPALDAAFAQAADHHKGILFLTPHLGSWEVAGQAIASACNAHGLVMTVMYKPAKHAALGEIIQSSRRRPGMATVPADLGGVRQTLRALKNGGAIGLLPDQVPSEGMGLWAKFFGKRAYTMTLAAKLAQTQECPVVMVWCERMSFGRGYRVFTQSLNLLDVKRKTAPDQALAAIVQQINFAVEETICQLPTQYLWGYARYKAPKPSGK